MPVHLDVCGVACALCGGSRTFSTLPCPKRQATYPFEASRAASPKDHTVHVLVLLSSGTFVVCHTQLVRFNGQLVFALEVCNRPAANAAAFGRFEQLAHVFHTLLQ